MESYATFVANSSPMASHEHALRKVMSFVAVCLFVAAYLLPLCCKPSRTLGTLFHSFREKASHLALEEGHEITSTSFRKLLYHLRLTSCSSTKEEDEKWMQLSRVFSLLCADFFHLNPLFVKRYGGCAQLYMLQHGMTCITFHLIYLNDIPF